MIQGLTVSLSSNLDGGGGSSSSSPSSSSSSLVLTSCPEYWRLSCFQLPWFYEYNKNDAKENTSRHDPPPPPPHIVAIGGTFWANGKVQSLTIDTKTRRAKIEMI